MKNVKFSIVICTNRSASYLNTCLKSLAEQNTPPKTFEIIVVFNKNDKDNLKEIDICISKWQPVLNISRILEVKTGLSHARNCGCQKANGKYLAFLDDDVKVDKNWLKKIMRAFQKYPNQIAVGGPIVPFYKSLKPDWFDGRWESVKKGNNERYLKNGETLSGSNFVIRKDILIKYQGFLPDLGMKGDQIGLAEETDLLERIEKDYKNVQYYLPDAVVYHLISPKKISIFYRLKRSFVAGKSLWIRSSNKSQAEAVITFIKMILGFVVMPFFKILQLIVRPKKIKTSLVNILSPSFYALGYLWMKIPIILLFLAFLVNGILWIISVPIWQFPDEQSHFAQVSYLAITGRNPDSVSNDLTREIYQSEYLLGTLRDKTGRNKFTFHPDYKIEYINSFVGKYEGNISDLTKNADGKTFIKREASTYPPGYYYVGAFLYRLFSLSDLYTRVYIVRLWSLCLYLLTLLVVYKIGTLIFSNTFNGAFLSILVGFQPMFSFASTGVNSDSLGNLLFTLFIYLSLKILYSKSRTFEWILIFMTTFLCIWTKPQFIITVPILLIIIFIQILKSFHINKLTLILFLFMFSTAIYLFKYADISGFTAFRSFQSRIDVSSLIKFTKEYTISHTYSEVMPWYWGIFKWLGVTYPRVIHRIINWIVLTCLFGFIMWFTQSIRKREWKNKEFKTITFLLLVAILFSIPIFIYDWFLWKTSGFVLGIQGRYFFPVITVHMVVLLKGWMMVCSVLKRKQKIVMCLLPILMILLNYYGLYTVLDSYYHVGFSMQFIYELSQYKPWFTKGFVFPVLAVISLLFNGGVVYWLLNLTWGDSRLRAK